jgi:hypothetical protein
MIPHTLMPNHTLQTTSEPIQQFQTTTEQSGPSNGSTNQHLDSLRLLNFRIPRDLKDQFQTKCRRNRIPMTSELTRMIQHYVIQDSMAPITSNRAQASSRVHPVTYRDPNTGLIITANEQPFNGR